MHDKRQTIKLQIEVRLFTDSRRVKLLKKITVINSFIKANFTICQLFDD